MEDEPAASSPPSLADEQKQLTRDRIRRAAMVVVARRGFDATVEEIARESGVSPRTIFRHYATQGSLILATVKDMFEACGRRPIACVSCRSTRPPISSTLLRTRSRSVL